MKKYSLIFFLIIVFFFSCEQPAPEPAPLPLPEAPKEKIPIKLANIQTFEHEGCEYIAFKNSEGINRGFGFMSHKGNCKNPIHIYNLLQPATDSLELSE